ncbi:MAG: GTP-binding protein [Eubacteriales bacterium]|nr:GTP-binding protein [Eubacteriales bacterium]
MATEIIILSGFLGAGKTTLIQRWLKEGAFHGRIAVVENDFGEVGVDAELLRSGNISVTELSAGCICCSLSGNFVRALEELIENYTPDTILIEPSGVGMLSDVKKACANPRILPHASVRCAVTIVDIKRVHRYLENFGAFYEDQIRRADTIVLSRVEQSPELIPAALERIFALNDRARVFTEPWDRLVPAEVLSIDPPASKPRTMIGRRTEHVARTAEDVFDTITIRPNRLFTDGDLHARFLQAEQCGVLLRAKGVVASIDGPLIVQYTLGETQLEPSTVNGNFLCFIGQGLDIQRLNELFYGE